MVGYAICKAARMGILSKEKYAQTGIDIVEGIVNTKLKEEDGELHLTGICHVAGLGPGDTRYGSVSYYLSQKIVSDDSKGVGPFMMAYAQMLMLKKEI